jgi:GAF domain-containing protein
MDAPPPLASHGRVGEPEPSRSTLLARLARQVTARHDLDDMLAEVFRCLRPLVSFGGGSIQLLDDDGWIRMAAAEPAAPAHVMAARIPLGASTAGRIILTEQATYLPDIGAHAGQRPVSDGVRSYLGVPLVADGRAIGVLQLDSPAVDAWSEPDRELLAAAAPIVAAAIQAARAYARAAAAQSQTARLQRRLAQAAAAAAAARTASRANDRLELERQLRRITGLLDDDDRAPAPVDARRSGPAVSTPSASR